MNPPKTLPAPAVALELPVRKKPSFYPEEFRAQVEGREKRALGEHWSLQNFGVNLTRLRPGAKSALLHRHSRQDEFIYILEGEPVLVTEDGEFALRPGMCAGFPAGSVAHQLVNRSDADVVYLEVGDRTAGDVVTYPHDDLAAVQGADGRWNFTRKDGRPY